WCWTSCSATSGSTGSTESARRRTSSASSRNAWMSFGSSTSLARNASSRGRSALRAADVACRVPGRRTGRRRVSSDFSRARSAMASTISAPRQPLMCWARRAAPARAGRPARPAAGDPAACSPTTVVGSPQPLPYALAMASVSPPTDQPGSPDVVRRLRGGTDVLTSAALKRLDAELPGYRELPAEDRSWIGLVAQSGISAFITWYEGATEATYNAAEIFRAAPPELTRSISLQHTLQLERVS